jgi:hypothetical protein
VTLSPSTSCMCGTHIALVLGDPFYLRARRAGPVVLSCDRGILASQVILLLRCRCKLNNVLVFEVSDTNSCLQCDYQKPNDYKF